MKHQLYKLVSHFSAQYPQPQTEQPRHRPMPTSSRLQQTSQSQLGPAGISTTAHHVIVLKIVTTTKIAQVIVSCKIHDNFDVSNQNKNYNMLYLSHCPETKSSTTVLFFFKELFVSL